MVRRKRCNVCLKVKEPKDFYPNKQGADGYQRRCIECTKLASKKKLEIINSDPVLKEKEITRHRDKYHRLGYKEIHKPTIESKRVIQKRYREKFPEKYKAQTISQHMVTKIKGNHLHHWSYNKEHYKDVIELSELEHNKAHRYMMYDQERMMYRRTDTLELLDTREKHEDYIFNIIKDKP